MRLLKFLFLSVFLWNSQEGPARSGPEPVSGLPSATPALAVRNALVDFDRWAERYASSSGTYSDERLREGVALAKARRMAFGQLIRTNPQRAFEKAVSSQKRQQLPAEIVAELETPVSGIGDFLVYCAIPAQGTKAVESIERFVRLDGRRYRAFVSGRLLNQPTRFQIPLRGVALNGAIALDEKALENGAASRAHPHPLAVSVPRSTKILVLRADFPDLPGDPQSKDGAVAYSAAVVQDVADREIASYYRDSSYGKVSMNFTVSPQVYRLPQPSGFYAIHGLRDEMYNQALAAAAGDFDTSQYSSVIVLFSWLGNVPGSQLTFGGDTIVGTPVACVNGEFDFRVVAHELGHSLGLLHANFWLTSDDDPVSQSGSSLEYCDPFDTMGANWGNDTRVDFNPWFKYLLGWITDDQVTTVRESGTYRVYRFDAPTSDLVPLALRVPRDDLRDYWIGIRRKFTDNQDMMHGAYVTWGYQGPHQSDLLGLGASVNDAKQSALPLGSSLVDTEAGLTITPVDEGGSGLDAYLDVQITFVPRPPPVLHLMVSPGRVTLYWPSWATNYVVETCNDPTSEWSTVPGTPARFSSTLMLRVHADAPAAFYRLRQIASP